MARQPEIADYKVLARIDQVKQELENFLTLWISSKDNENAQKENSVKPKEGNISEGILGNLKLDWKEESSISAEKILTYQNHRLSNTFAKINKW